MLAIELKRFLASAVVVLSGICEIMCPSSLLLFIIIHNQTQGFCASSRCFGVLRVGGAEKQNRPVIVLCVHFAAMTHVTALCPFQSFHGPLQCDHGRDQHPFLPHPLCRGGERTRRPRVLDHRLVVLHT